MTAEDIRNQITANLVRSRDISALAESEGRDFTAEERTNIKAALDDVAGFKAQLEQLQGDANIRRQITDLSAQYQPAAPSAGDGGSRTPTASGPQGWVNVSAGQQFLDDPDVKAWRQGLIRSGATTNAAFGHSPRVVTNTLISLGGALSAGELTSPQQTGILVPFPRRPLTIQDVITVGETSSDVVEYVEVTSETNAAANVAEATATAGSVGTKPESAVTFTRKQATVKTIAHWVAATRQALSDAGQLRIYIDEFLKDGLLQQLESQIISGGGTGENFAGLITAAGLSQAFSNDIFETTRKARTNLRVNGRVTPNAWLINPLDFEDMELTQDNEARYYGGGPFANEPNMRLWRVPVIEHEGVTEGTALLGDFRKAVLWKRSDPEIMVSDSHSDFFVRNLLAILGEMRAAFALIFPKAVISVDLTA